MSDTTDAKLDKLIEKVDILDTKVDGIDKLTEKVDQLDKKVDGLEGLHQKFDTMQADIKTIKHVQGDQGIRLRTIQTDVNNMKNSFRNQTEEVTRLGVMFEDFEHKFQAADELGT